MGGKQKRASPLNNSSTAVDLSVRFWVYWSQHYHAVGSAGTCGVEQTGFAEVRGGGVGNVTVPVGLGNTNWLCVFHGADCVCPYIP